MRTHHGTLAAVLWAALIAAAGACSDDGGAAGPPDQGVKKQDGASGKVDKGKPSPDKGAPAPGIKGWKDLPGKWEGAGGHSATLFKDGRVLIAGGIYYDSGSKGSAKAWLFNPQTNTFNPVEAMKQARGHHLAVLLLDGRVLVAGGRDGSSYNALAAAELFDPATRKWTKLPDMPAKRSGAAAVRLGNGRVLVAGGYGSGGQLDSLAIFDPKSKSWLTPARSMSKRRSAHSMTLVAGGKAIIAGGYGGVGSDPSKYGMLDMLEIYDPAKGTMTLSKAKLAEPRATHTDLLLADGRVLLVGGHCGSGCTLSGDELYDPLKDQAVKINHQGTPPKNHAVARLNDGRVLVVGGGFSDEKKVVILDPAGLFWKAGPSLKHGRFNHTVTVLLSGKVLVAGGNTGSPSDRKAPLVTVSEISTP